MRGVTMNRLWAECIGCKDEDCGGCAMLESKTLDIVKDVITKGDGGSTPSQYGIPTRATDLQDLIEHRAMSFSLGNIFKACYRYGKKNDNLYELNKMKWFIDRLIAEEEGG